MCNENQDCKCPDGKEKICCGCNCHKQKSNEIRVLKEFIMEFHPYYADTTMLNDLQYHELTAIVKEIAEEF